MDLLRLAQVFLLGPHGAIDERGRTAPRINSGQDVSELAVEVARAEFKFKGDAHTADALREITAVLREAAARFPRFSWEAKLITPRE